MANNSFGYTCFCTTYTVPRFIKNLKPQYLQPNFLEIIIPVLGLDVGCGKEKRGIEERKEKGVQISGITHIGSVGPVALKII